METFVSWDDKYNIGIEKIDLQHQQIIKMINNLYVIIYGKDQKNIIQKINETTNMLINYTIEHLSTEERFLDAVKYPKSNNHKSLHQVFALKVTEINRDSKDWSKAKSIEIMKFLKDWLLSHIAIEDKDFAFYIKSLNKK